MHKIKNTCSNSSGFTHMAVLITVILIGAIAGTGYLVYSRQANSSRTSEITQQVADTAEANLEQDRISEQEPVPEIPEQSAAPQVATKPTPKPSSSTPQSVTAPASVTPSIEFSNGNCNIKIMGNIGYRATIHTTNGRKGGNTTVEFSSSTEINTHAGGMRGMWVEVTIQDGNGTAVLSKTSGAITQDMCEAAGS